ncbi:MAG: diacylglycerol kinase [Patescibacteria group bacterium]|nr:diacylglycerol kinase [Patescibacteria group bacterium]
MTNIIDTKKEFSAFKRANSFVHAGRGIIVFLKVTPNAWIQLSVFLLVIIFGFHFNITYIEWIMVTFAAGIVLAAEAFNTAIEIDINLTSPGYHPYARDTKDVAAGAVLIASLMAIVIGILVFGHYIF